MKTAKLNFGVESAEKIFNAIIRGETTQTALYAFIHRTGTNKRQTSKALDLLREHKLRLKRNARTTRTIRNILKPYSAELAKGRDAVELILPILQAWRIHYSQQCGIGLMDEQILILKILESTAELKKLTGKSVPNLVTEG